MKQIKIIICLLLIAVGGLNNLWGQEHKNGISIGGTLAHYIKIEDFHVDPFDGYYTFPMSPGLELIYLRQIFPKLEVSTGINFQRVHVASNVDLDLSDTYQYKFRFNYNEISVPILLRKIFPLKAGTEWYITAGAYFGKQLNITTEIPLKSGWGKWKDITTVAGVSNDQHFSDIYIDAGYSKSHTWGDLSIAPFFKYRSNPTWLNTYQQKPNWGIKINFTLKF